MLESRIKLRERRSEKTDDGKENRSKTTYRINPPPLPGPACTVFENSVFFVGATVTTGENI